MKLRQSLWCKIATDGNRLDELVVGVCYKSPSAARDEVSKLFLVIEKAANNKVLSMGDFNFPGISWDTYDSDSDGESFRDLIIDSFMIRHVHEPTREQNILDLVITSQAVAIDNLLIQDHLGTSDHNFLVWDLIHCIKIKQYNTERRSFVRGNYNAMRDLLQGVDWDQELQDLNVEEIWQKLCKIIQIAIMRYIPLERKKTTKDAQKG
jgi:Endonuclease-reverse transcriptase